MINDRNTTSREYRVINHNTNSEVRARLLELARKSKGVFWDARVWDNEPYSLTEFYYIGGNRGTVIIRIAPMTNPHLPTLAVSKTEGATQGDMDSAISGLQERGLQLARI